MNVQDCARPMWCALGGHGLALGGDSASEDDDRVKEKKEPTKGQANKQEYHVARSEPTNQEHLCGEMLVDVEPRVMATPDSGGHSLNCRHAQAPCLP